MVTFYEYKGVLYRHLQSESSYIWVINYDYPGAPKKISYETAVGLKRVPIPESFLDESDISEKRKKRMEERLKIIAPLTQKERCVTDEKFRRGVAREIAKQNNMTDKTVLSFYWNFLARGERGLLPARRIISKSEKELSKEKRDMARALKKYFYSPKKMSLQRTYEMMLLDEYRGPDGTIKASRPTFSQFKYYYESNRNASRHIITREGIGEYQKNFRPLLGKGDSGIDFVGAYEMDATQADIYIVSRYNRKPIGRPVVYLAVDIASRLIAGIHVGLEGTSDSVLACLSNAACDKMAYCREFGIEIAPEMWPCTGLPGFVYTDRGRDFISSRTKELCKTFGMEITSLPAFRPDLKGYVEKTFDCLQSRYKPLLRGKGVIERKIEERGGPDYYQQARIDLFEFTKIVIECVLYYNAAHIQKSVVRVPEMAQAGIAPVAADMWQWYVSNGKARLISVDENMARLMLLPRGTGSLTRKGVEFKNLYYFAEDRMEDYVRAGIDGREKVEVAYSPLDDNTIFLVEDGVYHKLTLTLASRQMQGLSYAEVDTLLQEETRLKKELEPAQTAGAVNCASRIREIAERAEKTEPHTKRDTTSQAMREFRDEEIDRLRGTKK